MGLMIAAVDVQELGVGIWTFQMPQEQLQIFGRGPVSEGPKTVILLRKSQYDAAARTLSFDLGAVKILNNGTGEEVLAIGFPEVSPTDEHGQLGKGDQQFLAMAKRSLSLNMQKAAQALLEAVRHEYPGDLLKGEKNNFSNQPDNFWYVIIQPRIDQLSITVRGEVAHFDGLSALEIKDDRGNTRFKVTGPDDVTEALQLIRSAKKRH